MDEPEVLYAVDENVAPLTLNAPDRLTALSEPMRRGLADAAARTQDVHVRIGRAPGGGGFWLLPRIVGLTRALELVLSGETIDADHALRRFTRAAPLGVQVARRALYHGLDMSFETALEMIRPHVGELRRAQDHREGLAALREKREPRFQGR